MSDARTAIQKIAKTDNTLDRAIVLSVDKDAMTCSVQQVSNDLESDEVSIKPIANDDDSTQMGIVCFPAIGSQVIIGQVDGDNDDLVVLGMTKIESVLLDFGSNFKFSIKKDGKPYLNSDLFTFNDGSNGGLPLLIPLVKTINDLQKQVNSLIDAFKTHTHPGVTPGAGITALTTRIAPAKTIRLITRTDIENKKIKQ